MYYKSICQPWQISISSLKPANKRPGRKEEDLIKVSFRKSITLLDNRLGVILVNTSQ